MNTHDRDHTPIDRDHHAVEPSTGDLVGEGVGGVSGALTGAALGSAGGPLGTIIGGIAGAAGGWWTGRSVSEAAAHYTEEDDSYYRGHHESRSGAMDYDRARQGYALGHIAGNNPDYRGKSYDDIEPHIRGGYQGREDEYNEMRDYVRHGYERVIRPSGGEDRVTIS
ncbi:MAG: hypothetical protein M3409_11915 [Gemmatimonadota bacterium]|jgi:hypothetical protein|nr:hypothetical protein [Gemmatimonadota bacterium]